MGANFDVNSSGNLRANSIDTTPVGVTTPNTGAFSAFKCNHATFSNMDWGSVNMGTVSYGSVTTQTISINGASFSGQPNIVCTPSAGGSSDPNIAKVSCGVYNAGTSQVTINCTINDPLASSVSVIVYWFAFE